MPSIFEKCSCGAEMDVRDAHYEQCKWMVKAWREAHKHEHFSSTTTDHFAIDSSRNDSVPTGFTREERGLTYRPSEIDPDGDDENRRRKIRR
jgi:hypothetical protein